MISIYLILLGNIFFFGHELMSLIFRPISQEFAPYILLDKNYVKVKKGVNPIIRKSTKSKLKKTMKDFVHSRSVNSSRTSEDISQDLSSEDNKIRKDSDDCSDDSDDDN